MSIPFALSLSKYVNSAGTDIGFASLLAVALLAVLYFAGARETRTLRDQLDDAHNRLAALEARLAQVLRNQAAGARGQGAGVTQVPQVPGRPGVVPAPQLAGQSGAIPATAVARGQSGLAGAGAVAGAAALAGAGAGVASGVLLGAPAGAGAPALGAATKLIPSPQLPAPAPVPASIGAPVAAPVAVPAGAVPAGAGAPVAYADGDDGDYADGYGPEDTMFVPAATAAAAANGQGGGSGAAGAGVGGAGAGAGAGGAGAGGSGGGGGAAVATPPRVQFGEGPQGPPPRRTIPTIAQGPSRSRRTLVRVLGGALALLVVAAIVVALLTLTGSGAHHQNTVTHAQVKAKTKLKTGGIVPARIKVSVLNGTAVGGLAARVGDRIAVAGYKVPKASVTNAAVQTATTTTVGYLPGYKAAAFQVAKSLGHASGVAITRVLPANQTSITSCATPTGSGQAGSCPANVIVTVGTDLAGVANSATNG